MRNFTLPCIIRIGLAAKFLIAPNAYQRHVNIPNYELNYRRDILDNVQFSAGLGYYQAGGLCSVRIIFTGNMGASWFLTSYLAIDIRYVDVDLETPHHNIGLHPGEFYPRPLENKYLLSVTLGF